MNAVFAAIILVLAAITAHAQTTTSTCWSDGVGTVTCQTSPSAPGRTPGQFGYLHDAGKDGMEAAGRQLGQIVNQTLQPKPKSQIDAVVATKCGKYKYSIITYSDDSTNRADLKDVAVDPLTTVKIVNMGFRIVDLTCDEAVSEPPAATARPAVSFPDAKCQYSFCK